MDYKEFIAKQISDIEIKKCRFCQNDDAELRFPTHADFFVFCNCCEAQGPRSTQPKTAIVLWNDAWKPPGTTP